MARPSKTTGRASVPARQASPTQDLESPRSRHTVRASADRADETESSERKDASPPGLPRLQNSIRLTSPRRALRPPTPSSLASGQDAPRGPVAPTPAPGAPARVVPTDVPQEVRQRYVQVGRKYYFADGAHAFTDRGRRLTTRSENTEVIRTLVLVAEHRRWTDITVSGTERFRKEAWFAARSAGLTVRGYQPTNFEQERLVRALARREAAREVSGLSADDARPIDTGERADRVASEAQERSESRLISGRLVDYGRAAYQHDPHEKLSYFLKLETGRGERTLWGVDLERALRESLTSPQLGDEIGVQALGREAVVVKAQERDEEGRVVGEKALDAHRNRWIVEKRDFFQSRAAAAETLRDNRVHARDAVRQHPELMGTYLYLKSAEEFAKQKIRDPEDQKRFVATVRQALAQSVSQGEPLPPVRLREPKTPERPAERTKGREARKPDLVRE